MGHPSQSPCLVVKNGEKPMRKKHDFFSEDHGHENHRNLSGLDFRHDGEFQRDSTIVGIVLEKYPRLNLATVVGLAWMSSVVGGVGLGHSSHGRPRTFIQAPGNFEGMGKTTLPPAIDVIFESFSPFYLFICCYNPVNGKHDHKISYDN